MMKKLICASIASMIAASILISGAMAAEKLVCFSQDKIVENMNINHCVAKGMECGLIDEKGFVRILSPREIELTKKINPKAFQMKAYGWKEYRSAPDIPPLPVSPEI